MKQPVKQTRRRKKVDKPVITEDGTTLVQGDSVTLTQDMKDALKACAAMRKGRYTYCHDEMQKLKALGLVEEVPPMSAYTKGIYYAVTVDGEAMLVKLTDQFMGA